MKSITLNQLSVISKTNYFTFLGVFKHVDEEFVCSCVFLCLQPFCLENDVLWVELNYVAAAVVRWYFPVVFMYSCLFVFSGWRRWVRVKSLCWVTQRRRSSHPQTPLWTSVWTTRPWTPVWSVTARRLTTTMWCATPPHPCNLRPRRIWLAASRPLLCSPLFGLLSLDWSVTKFERTRV